MLPVIWIRSVFKAWASLETTEPKPNIMRYLIALTLCLSSLLCGAQSFNEFQIHHRINPEVYQVNEGQRITVKLTSGKRVVGFFNSIDLEHIFLSSFDGDHLIHAVPREQIVKVNIRKASNEIANVALFTGAAITAGLGLVPIVAGIYWGDPALFLVGLGSSVVSLITTRYAINRLSYRLHFKNYKLVLPREPEYLNRK